MSKMLSRGLVDVGRAVQFKREEIFGGEGI